MSKPLTAAFVLPAGVTAYAFFPGAHRVGSTTDIYLASGTVLAIECDSEALASTGFVLDVHDYMDTGTGRLIVGGSFPSAGCLTVTGPGTLQTSTTSEGGFDVYATAKPGAFAAGNRRFSIAPNLATMQFYPIMAPCIHGMAVLFTGGAATAAEHKISIIYQPMTLGAVRRRMRDNMRTMVNSGALTFA